MIIPIQSTAGTTKNLRSINNIDLPKQDISTDIIDMITKVNKSLISYYLESLVSFGVRYTGSENSKKAADFIFNEFQNLGLNACIDPWRYIGYKSQNVIATLNGTDPSSDAVIIVCAHYDTTINSPGANDDGSGIAAMLAIANITSKYSFNHTICFIATSGEEIGLYGSRNFAQKCYERNENIFAVLNIDTIGNTTEEGKEIVYLLKPERSERIKSTIEETCQIYKEYIGLSAVSICDRGNDHKSFLNFGFDAIQFVQLSRGDYPYHTPEDTIEKINYDYLVNVTKLILATTARLTDKSIDVQVRIVTPKEGYVYLFNRPIFYLSKLNIGKKTRDLTYIIGRAKITINITTKEEINSVAFCIDGHSPFPGFLQEPPYEWIIQISSGKIFPITGKHLLSVYVVTDSGKIAYDEMDIFTITLY